MDLITTIEAIWKDKLLSEKYKRLTLNFDDLDIFFSVESYVVCIQSNFMYILSCTIIYEYHIVSLQNLAEATKSGDVIVVDIRHILSLTI